MLVRLSEGTITKIKDVAVVFWCFHGSGYDCSRFHSYIIAAGFSLILFSNALLNAVVHNVESSPRACLVLGAKFGRGKHSVILYLVGFGNSKLLQLGFFLPSDKHAVFWFWSGRSKL